RLDFLAPVADDQANETQLCLQALFDKRGVVRPKVVALQQELRDHGLIFIQLVYTLDEYQKRGLMRPMLTLFRSLVRQLPEWFAFDDTLVLVPAKPDGSASDSWGRRRLGSVDNQLSSMYEKCDGYVPLMRDARVGDSLITVLGRQV
ncbi:hypothetical protein LTR53_016331, partial [Teratosphaeriaceae sp. CCFEE 6253]